MFGKDKESVDFGESELDSLGMDDIDWGSPFEETNTKDKKGARSAVTEFVSSARDTVKDHFLDRDTIRRLVSGGLHKGYTQAFNAYDAIESGLGDVLKDNSTELNSTLSSMKRKTDKWSPTAQRFLPKFLREAMEDATAPSYSSGPSQTEHESNMSGLDQMFAFQAKQAADGNVREAIRENREQKRFNSESETQINIGKGIGRLVGYQDSITINYHRKSLEIGYRQLDIAVRMLTLQQAHFSKTQATNESILKNTGLPDFLKMHNVEVVKQQMTNKLAGTITNTVGNWASNFWGRTKDNASQMLNGALQFKDGVEQQSAFGKSRAEAFGNQTGAMTGAIASNFLENEGHALVKKLKPFLSKVPGFDSFGETLRENFTQVPQKINSWVKSETTSEGALGWGEEFLKSLFDTYTTTGSISGVRSEELDQPAIFDNLVYTSITEVMPGYLASIDKWIKVVATGEDKEEMAYSHHTGGFVDRKTLADQSVRILLKNNSGRALRQEVDALLRDMGAADLSSDALRALRVRLLKDMSGGHPFKPEKYTEVDAWDTSDDSIADELISFFSKQFAINPDGSNDRSVKGRGRLNDVVDKYDAAQRRLPDFGQRMNVLKKVTGRRQWRDMGLTKYNGIEGDIIDLDKLFELLVNEGGDAFDPREEVPKDPVKLKEYLKRKKAAEDELLNHGVGNNDRVDVDGGIASGKGGVRRKQSSRPQKITEEINVNLGQALAQLPQPQIAFPDLLNTADDGTHLRLDSLIEGMSNSNQFLADIILAMAQLGQGGIGGGGTEDSPDDAGAPIPGPADPRKSLLRKVLGGAAWTGKKAIQGTAWYLRKSYSLIGKGMWAGAKGAVWAAKAPFKPIDGLGVCDIFAAGEEKPLMTARDIRRGLYQDVNTQKTIETIKDITGAVRRLDTNEIILTEEDFEKGLYNGQGQSLARWMTGKALTVAGALGKGATWYFGKTYGLMWKTAKKITEIAYDQFVQYDAYFPGDEEPRITSKRMKRGYYRTAEGEPITSLKDITGPVFDIDGNEIISQEEIDKYKSLYTRNGSLLFTFGRGVVNLAGKTASLALKGAKWYGKQVGRFYKGMWNASSWAVKKVAGMFRGRGKSPGQGTDGDGSYRDPELDEMNLNLQGQQLETQTKILDILRGAFDGSRDAVKGDTDGDGERDYSWRDILRRRKEAREGKGGVAGGDNSDVVNALETLGDRLDKKLEVLIDTTEEAGETSLLEDASDLANLRGGGEGGEGKRGRGKAARGGRGKRGLLRRAGGGIKNAASALWNNPMLRNVAGVAGSALLSGGGALLSGAGSLLGGAATLIGGAISAPVLLGVAAVAGVAYLGYRFYKANKAKDFPIFCLRMAQYGIDPKDEERVKAMLELEQQCSRSVRIADNGEASMDSSNIDMTKLSTIFKFDTQARINKFADWVGSRFRPVYLAHCKAMDTLRNTTALQSADTSIGDGELEAFLKIVDLDGMKDVYNRLDVSPFDSDLDADADDVASSVDYVRTKRRLENSLKKQSNNAGNEVATKGLTGAAALGAIATTTGAAIGSGVGSKIIAVGSNGSDDPRRIAQGLQFAPMGIAAAAAATFTSKISVTPQTTALNIPTAVRYKTYGLRDLEMAKCMQIQQVEDLYWDQVVYSGTSAASFGGNDAEVKQKVLDIFKPENDVEKDEVLRWLDYRFVPVFLQYCISVRRRYNGDARDGWRNLTGPLMKEVLDETTQTQVETTFSSRSVWEIMNSPWPNYQVETAVGSVKKYIESLDMGDTGKVLDVAGMETQKRTESTNMKYGTKLSNVALGNQRANPMGPGVGNNGTTFGNMAKIYSGQAVAGGAKGQSPTGQGDGSILYNGSFGNQVQHPGGGTGGDINQLPNNTGAGLAEMGPVITGAAKMVGFDPTIALNVAAVESRLDPKASSGIAHGLFQFIKGTWNSMMKKHGDKYGIAPNTPSTDPRANAILGVEYLKENYQGLSSTLGGNVSDLDLYMAHFLGLGGARRFLSAGRSDPSFMHTGNGVAQPQRQKGDGGNAVTGSNMSIFFKDYKSAAPTQARNVGEVLAEMDRRMNVGRKIAGNPTSKTASQAPAESSVPTGGTPSDTAAANPVPTLDPMKSQGMGTGIDKDAVVSTPPVDGGSSTAGGVPSPTTPNIPGVTAPTAMAGSPAAPSAPTAPPSVPTPPPTPASVAAEANAGASGTPSSAMPMAVAQTINRPADPGMAPIEERFIVPAVNATTAAQRESLKSNEAAQQISMESTNGILDRSLIVQSASRDLLVEIRNMLANKSSSSPPAPTAPTPPQRMEPFPRKPLDTKRGHAVT